jgi:hypothetical protein
MDDIARSDSAPTSRGLTAGDRVFQRFTLLRQIGRGGMGVVWLARDDRLEADVALKFLPDPVRWDVSALATLRRETRRSRELTHPHIVRVHDIHEDAGAAAIAMEYLSGGSLHQLRGGRIPPVLNCAEITVWLPGLCAALDHAHAQGVVHRDLKPANLLVAADGAVKISDFGIAQPLFETALRVSQWAPSGTLAYMSPQQQFGEPASAADDIYALGATLYELLTGKPPFYTGNLAAQIERRTPDSLAARSQQLDVTGEAIPRAWEEIIAACLAKRPEDRPHTAGEVAARLTAPSDGRTHRRKFVTYYVTNYFMRRTVWLALLAMMLGAAAWSQWRRPAEGEGVAAVTSSAGFASDATRALVAWNLDGDGAEAAGRGWELQGFRTVPTSDRFGRIDRATVFNGSAGLELAAPPELRWARTQPFTISVWVRPDTDAKDGAVIANVHSDRVGDAYWELTLGGRRPRFFVATAHQDDGDGVVGEAALILGKWNHVAAVHDGLELRLYLDGHLVGRAKCRPGTKGTAPLETALRLGFGQKIDPNKFVGALDEMRIWRRPLSVPEIAALADPAPEPHWALTLGHYAETTDLPAAVVREFGAEARLADWAELRRWHADDIRAWADEQGIATNGESIYVQREGQRLADETRNYFFNRFDGVKPDYFLVHEELGGMSLALGSWYGLNLRALVARPFVAPRQEKLTGDMQRGVTAAFASGDALSVGAVSWRQEFRRLPNGARVQAETSLTLKDGRVLRARCSESEEGNFVVSLGEADRPQRVRTQGVGYERIEFTLVWRAGRLDWRGVSVESGVPLFQERLLLPEFSPAEVAAVRVSGVDSAELTAER